MSDVFLPDEFRVWDDGVSTLQGDDVHIYKTSGVCPSEIRIRLEGDRLSAVQFVGGCSGNTQAIKRVAEGMTISEIARLWEGIRCGSRPTSCVDQMILGLYEARGAQSEG